MERSQVGQPGTRHAGIEHAETDESRSAHAGIEHAETDEPGQRGHGRSGTGSSSIGEAAAARMRGFLAFWYDFVVGDDWLVAAGVLVALVLTYALSRTTVAAWWLMPVAVATLLPVSLRRLIRRR